MQINWKKVESRVKPVEVDKTLSQNGVYIRQNIKEDKRIDENEKEYIVFCYDEAFLTHNEYEQHINADYIVNAIQLKHEAEIIDTYTLQLIEGGIL